MAGSLSGFQARLERRTARMLHRLPPRWKSRFARRLENHDRSALDPTLRLLLALSDRRIPLSDLPLEKCREQYAQMFRAMDFNSRSMARLRDHEIPASAGLRLHLREYRARDSATLQPAVLFFHGGGFTIGSVPIYERLCRFLSDALDMPVFSLEYRLAPEHGFPAWVDDARVTWQWLQDNAPELGIDGTRLGVMGDSAGGNLSAVLSQQCARLGLVMPAAQCLVYPSTDQRMNQPSFETLGEGFGLDRALMNWFRSHYLPDASLIPDPRLSPLLADDVGGQPSTVLVVCADPLRDEGLAYGQKLRDAAVPVLALDYPHLIHGFVGMGGVLSAAREALVEICDTFGKMLTDNR